jgi:hypothetical protein
VRLQRIVFMGGGAGVDLFFVLSGFLIGGILLDARTSRSYFKTFYARRFFRIFPLYYAWILLYIAMVIFAGPMVERHTHFGEKLTLNFEIYSHFFFIQNLGFVYFTGLAQAWFSPMWSWRLRNSFTWFRRWWCDCYPSEPLLLLGRGDCGCAYRQIFLAYGCASDYRDDIHVDAVPS